MVVCPQLAAGTALGAELRQGHALAVRSGIAQAKQFTAWRLHNIASGHECHDGSAHGEVCSRASATIEMRMRVDACTDKHGVTDMRPATRMPFSEDMDDKLCEF